MGREGKSGITANTTKNIMFGAGTIHKGLKYTEGESGASGSWNFESTIIGATSGGSKITITPEIFNVELDGALVKFKGGNVKTGETATMEINFAEITKEIIKMAAIASSGVSEDTNYDLIESKPDIEAGDYVENLAFVGKTLDGRNIIVIMDNALCTSGIEMEGKNKENSVPAYTFECNADPATSDLQTLPWHIYYPKPASV